MTKKHLYRQNHHFVAISSNSTTTSSKNTTASVSNTTAAANSTSNSTSNSTAVVPSSSSSDDSDTGLIIGLVIGGLIFCALVGLGIWFYLKWKQKKIIKDYTMNPETFLAPQKLSMGQKMKLRNWELSKDPKFQIPDFSSKSVTTLLGSYFQLNFTQDDGIFQSVIAGTQVDSGKDNSYFEIEVDSLPNKETMIAIGFSSDTDFVKTHPPGAYPGSVGFQSVLEKSEVFMNNKSLITFEFSVKYGETLGIGIRGKDKRCWFSYNGQFLNPPAPSEKPLTEKEIKRKETEFSRMDPEKAKEIKEKEAVFEKEAIKKKITYLIGKKKFFPVIGAKGPCVLHLNVGGMPFRMFQKEIATGLL